MLIFKAFGFAKPKEQGTYVNYLFCEGYRETNKKTKEAIQQITGSIAPSLSVPNTFTKIGAIKYPFINPVPNIIPR